MSVTGTVPNTMVVPTTYESQEAGEALSAYSVVYLDGTLIKKADASDAARMPAVGMIKAAVAQAGLVDVWYRGIITNSAWSLTSGQGLFLMSGGVIGHNAPDVSGNVVQLLGEALTKTIIHFDPEDTIMVIGH